MIHGAEAAPEAAQDGQQWWALHLHPQLRSTRSLERFRNQVASIPFCSEQEGQNLPRVYLAQRQLESVIIVIAVIISHMSTLLLTVFSFLLHTSCSLSDFALLQEKTGFGQFSRAAIAACHAAVVTASSTASSATASRGTRPFESLEHLFVHMWVTSDFGLPTLMFTALYMPPGIMISSKACSMLAPSMRSSVCYQQKPCACCACSGSVGQGSPALGAVYPFPPLPPPLPNHRRHVPSSPSPFSHIDLGMRAKHDLLSW